MPRYENIYSVVIPIWFLLFLPSGWLFVLPALFVVDAMILLSALKIQKIPHRKEILKQAMIKIWIFGFTAYMIGATILFTSQLNFGAWWYEYLAGPIALNPFDNWYALLFTLVAIAAAGFIIYLFNYKFSFYETEIPIQKRKRLALILALVTAPYFFLIPSQLTSAEETKTIGYFTNHIVRNVQSTADLTFLAADGTQKTLALASEEALILANGINTAKQSSSEFTANKPADYQLKFYSPIDQADSTAVPLWRQLDGDQTAYFFQYNGAIYRMKDKWTTPCQEIIQTLTGNN